MLNLRKIAITGGVASGKTTVCQFLRELGAYVVEADAIAHELLDPTTDLGQQIIRLLGLGIVKDGQISRRAIAQKVFHSKELLEKLEALLHPAVLFRMNEIYSRVSREERATLFVVEVPLLFEAKWEPLFDAVIAVESDEKSAKERFAQAGYPEDEYEKRMKRQISPSEKAKRAHYTIKNRGSLEDLRSQVFTLYQTLHQ